MIFWLSVLVLGSALASEREVNPDLSRYAKTEGFRWFLNCHTNVSDLDSRATLIRISVFWKDDQRARQYVVDRSGEESDARYISNSKTWGHELGGGRTLSKQEFASLKRAIAKLPIESASPPINRLVLVTFNNGKDWVTRSYDKRALPSALRLIIHIVGEQPELTMELSE